MNADMNKLNSKNKLIILINKARRKQVDFNFSKELALLIKNNEDAKESVDKYFEDIYQCIQDDSLDFIIELLKNRWYDLIKKHIIYILVMAQRDKNEEVLPAFCKDYLNLSPEGEKISNLGEILDFLGDSPSDLLAISQKLRGYSSKTDELLEKSMQQHSLDISKYLFLRERTELYCDDIKDTIDVGGYAKFIERILFEIGQRQNSKLNDIETLPRGASAKPFGFKNMILKVGLPPKTYNMPNSKYFLQPLIRIELKSNKGKPFACVEVTNRVDTNFSIEEKTNENLYQFWKKIRDEGIIWTDVRWNNVGKLLQRNIPVHNGVEMYSDSKATGLEDIDIGEPLDKGKLVVVDLDYVYHEDDLNIIWPTNGFGRKFEARYQREKEQEVQKIEEQDER